MSYPFKPSNQSPPFFQDHGIDGGEVVNLVAAMHAAKVHRRKFVAGEKAARKPDPNVREIVQAPAAVLRTRCEPVLDGVDESKLQQLAAELVATMNHHPNCVGLAANQIGWTARVIAIRSDEFCGVLVNPEIVGTKGEPKTGLPEGCMSLPGVLVKIARYPIVKVQHAGGRLKFSGMASTIVQHEIDHLDGKLITDYEVKR